MRHLAIALGLLIAMLAGVQAQTDHFAGNDRVRLHVQVTLDGSDRKNLPNGVEWFAITAHRELDLVYSLVDVGMDGVPIVGGPREGAVPPEMLDLESRLADCGDDQVCLAGVMMQFAQSGQGGANPFEAMTTVTVKIVSQLTGDTEFASPEPLVSFALGLTLFVITLGLNVLALYVVRKYREQYE